MSRRTTRTAILLSALLTPVLLAGPALAADPLGPAEGGDGGAQVTTAQALLLYVLVPLALLLGISALVWLPGMLRGQRYRPQRGGWAAAPVWFAGPPDPTVAVETADVAGTQRGGAGGSW